MGLGFSCFITNSIVSFMKPHRRYHGNEKSSVVYLWLQPYYKHYTFKIYSKTEHTLFTHSLYYRNMYSMSRFIKKTIRSVYEARSSRLME